MRSTGYMRHIRTMHRMPPKDRLSRRVAGVRRHDVQSPAQVADSKTDEEYQPEDDLTACPICNKRVKEAEVFPHLDVHNEKALQTGKQSSNAG